MNTWDPFQFTHLFNSFRALQGRDRTDYHVYSLLLKRRTFPQHMIRFTRSAYSTNEYFEPSTMQLGDGQQYFLWTFPFEVLHLAFPSTIYAKIRQEILAGVFVYNLINPLLISFSTNRLLHIDIEHKNIDGQFTKDSKLSFFGMLCDQRIQLSFRYTRTFTDTRYLNLSSLHTDIRI